MTYEEYKRLEERMRSVCEALAEYISRRADQIETLFTTGTLTSLPRHYRNTMMKRKLRRLL